MTDTSIDPALDQWRTYDEFTAGIDTYRLPNVSLAGNALTLTLEDGTALTLRFNSVAVGWTGFETSGTDPYDAVAVRDDVVFVNIPLERREREAITVVFSRTTHRATVIRSSIDAAAIDGIPQVGQHFWAATTDGGVEIGEAPGPSRDLIGKRNLYRYSPPEHLYEHVYISSQRYAWQCLEGVQRGHGDMDLSTVWKFADGLYLFCFREFRNRGGECMAARPPLPADDDRDLPRSERRGPVGAPPRRRSHLPSGLRRLPRRPARLIPPTAQRPTQ